VTSIASWAGSGTALITAGACWLLLRHLGHLPAGTHPWLHRLVIIGMYSAGLVLTVTAAGTWILAQARALIGLVGSTTPGSGVGWAAITIGALALALTVGVALIWTPGAQYAYVAAVTPLVLALAPPGSAGHRIYAATAGVATHLVTQLATRIGG
jgi:hypothetical protein